MTSNRLLLLLFSILGTFAQNLISDGDFEGLALGYHPSSSTWYSPNGTGFVISRVSPWTNALSLLSTPNTTICQKIQNVIYKRRYSVRMFIGYQGPTTLTNALFFYYYKSSVVSFSRFYNGSAARNLFHPFQATNINNEEILCFKCQANLTRAPDPLTEDFVVDSITLYEDASILI